MDLEWNKCCVVDGSPTTVLSSSKPIQDSPQIRLENNGFETGRRKIEFSGQIDTINSPYRIIDSLCGSNEEDTDQDSFSVMSNSDGTTSSFDGCNDSPQSPVRSKSEGIVEFCSPAHLHGLLQLSTKRGIPFFNFSVKSLEESIVAKTWKEEKTFNWIYTFHSGNRRRKNSNAIGQLNVSCYVSSDLKPSIASTMVTEFTLYDTAHLDPSPAAAKLHPGLEIAAIVVRVPYCKRESLKFTKIDFPRHKLIDFYQMEQGDETNSDCRNVGTVMQVVVPYGRHSLPSGERCGPLPLLHRWRLGGACDCGGWDMACPLAVFSNLNFRVAEDLSMVDNRHPVVLFHEGRKDSIPAFTMKAIGKGKYAVNFHAQLSCLQAFSISVALLHAAESSTATRRIHSLPPHKKIETSPDTIMEEPILKPQNLMESIKPYSFVLYPPFSPISHV